MKKFMEEKKRMFKFKMAGPGRKLGDGKGESAEDGSTPSESGTENGENSAEGGEPKRTVSGRPTHEENPALASYNAALKRCEAKPASSSGAYPKVPLAYQKRSSSNQKPELTDQKQGSDGNKNASTSTEPQKIDKSKLNSVNMDVQFTCPALDDSSVLTKEAWENRIKKHIADVSDPVLASSLKIKTLNPRDKVDLCVSTLSAYLNNILDAPDEERYRRINCNNKVLIEKVLACDGGLDFLEAVGFRRRSVNDKNFLIYCCDSCSELMDYLSVLVSTDEIELVLHRDVTIYRPGDLMQSEVQDCPDEFFHLSRAECKKIQEARSVELESQLQLKTREMREQEANRRKIGPGMYTRIRVQYPNGDILQGTFLSEDKLVTVKYFIMEYSDVEDGFSLIAPPATVLNAEHDEKSLVELGLASAVLLKLHSVNQIISLKEDALKKFYKPQSN